MMLTKSYRKISTKECPYGRHCCTTDDRKGVFLRRSGRRIEKRIWQKEVRDEG